MLLQELFTRPLQYEIIYSDDYAVRAQFRDPDGNLYHVSAYKNTKELPDDPDSWDIEFSTIENNKTTDKLIGGRKSIPIMSTIVDFVKDFVQNRNDIDEITFISRSKEHSRFRLYDRLAKMLAKQLGWNYLHVNYGDHNFIISKPEVDQSRWEIPSVNQGETSPDISNILGTSPRT